METRRGGLNTSEPAWQAYDVVCCPSESRTASGNLKTMLHDRQQDTPRCQTYRGVRGTQAKPHQSHRRCQSGAWRHGHATCTHSYEHACMFTRMVACMFKPTHIHTQSNTPRCNTKRATAYGARMCANRKDNCRSTSCLQTSRSSNFSMCTKCTWVQFVSTPS